MASTHTLTGNVYDLTGATLGATGVRVTVVTNLPAKSALIDKTTNSIHLGGKHADLDPSTGLFTIDLIDTSATDLNVAANTLEYEVRAEYVNPATRVRSTWTSGWFPFTADANLADITTDVEPLAVQSASEYAAAAAASAAEAEAISGLTGEDAAVAFLVEDSGSATAGALSATYATVASLNALPPSIPPTANLDLVDSTLYIGHRGGSGLMPEETLDGFRAVSSLGTIATEVDCWPTSDGVPAVMHDSTIDRTTTGTGNISALTAAQFKALTVDASTWFANTAPNGSPPLFDDVLRELGNRVILTPECKTPTVRAAMIASLDKFNISPKSVLIQSVAIADCVAFKAAGYESMWMGAIIPDMANSAVANGINWLGTSHLDASLNAAWVADCHAKGLKVCVYSLTSLIERDAMLALGVDAIMATDPIYLSGRAPIYRRDQFHKRGPVPGHRLNNGSFMEWFPGDYYGWSDEGFSRFTALHYLRPTNPQAFTLDATLNITSGAATGWAGIWIGATDQPFVDGTNANYNGYHLFIRPNGQINLNYTGPGVASTVLGSLSAATGTDIAYGVDVPLRITVTATTVRIERIDVPADFVQVTNNAVRGQFISLTRSGLACKWKNIITT